MRKKCATLPLVALLGVIAVEFKHPRAGNEAEARVLLEFKTDRMTVNNAVVY